MQGCYTALSVLTVISHPLHRKQLANRHSACWRLYSLKMEVSEKIITLFSRDCQPVADLKSMDAQVTDQRLIRAILSSLPMWFEHFIVAIDGMLTVGQWPLSSWKPVSFKKSSDYTIGFQYFPNHWELFNSTFEFQNTLSTLEWLYGRERDTPSPNAGQNIPN